MSKHIYTSRRLSLTFLIAGVIIIQTACKKETSNTPVITSVRSYSASPGDSLLHEVGPGQWIVITGKNLKGALQINFDGVASSFNDALFSDTSAAVLIPSVIAFPTVPANQLNTINYITTHGQTTFSFKIAPPAPTISNISNENANPGDTVTINGLNFFFIQNVSFAGTTISTYTSATNGTSISFTLPSNLPQSGPVTVTTGSGSATTPYNVNDVETGVLCNYDDINTYSWDAFAVLNDATMFPGNRGYYAQLNATNVGANDYGWYNGGRGMNTNNVQWIPTAHLSDPVADYVVKFEISVGTPWNAGTLYVSANYGFTYIARYAPWLNADGSATTINPQGWRTVTIPFSAFRTQPTGGLDGQGTSLGALTDLIGPSGNQPFCIWLINDGSTSIPSFNVAIDNIRVEKIQ